MFNIGEFIQSSRRVMIVSKKPDWNEFQTIAKITGLGIVLIALVGFIISFVFKFFGI
ncbi:MAG: protein translocase SEC61 complex subunit gamma [Candidatus Diapherotrites archaeon]